MTKGIEAADGSQAAVDGGGAEVGKRPGGGVVARVGGFGLPELHRRAGIGTGQVLLGGQVGCPLAHWR